MNEFIEQFLIEARELVEQAIADLLALEKTPDDKRRLDSAFRAFHTLKGGAGIVDFTVMAHAVHAAEDVLSSVRSGARAITTPLIGDCLTCLDQVVQWLDVIERTGDLPGNAEAEAGAIVARFACAADEGSTADAAVDQGDIETIVGGQELSEERLLSPPAREIVGAQIALLKETAPQGSAGRMASAGVVAANVLKHAGRASDADRVLRAADTSLTANDPRVLRDAIEGVLSGTLSDVAAAVSVPFSELERQARTLRVDAARIDALVNLTGELTVAKNAIGHAAKLIEQEASELGTLLKDRYALLHRLVGELQHAVLGMRVLPLGHVFQRFPRLVREMAAELRKPADLVIEGGDTEADKAIVENLFEPLLHVLRNALDHGIENASVRAALHKPPAAVIHLRAGRQGEHVVVEVSDDGGGIDVVRIRQLAQERNLIPGEALSAMSDEAVIDIIFEPGFSTAADVTELSGRGVGMDVVRSAVARLAGHVGVESRAGLGTTVRFTLPFSVMMTRVMVVGAGEQTFGIPLDAVVETLRIGVDRIAPIGAAHVVVTRDRTIPLVSLAAALDVTRDERNETEATIVITKIEGHYGALRVDRIGERMEVMLKPLDGLLTGMHGLAGSTLLGDGSVLLILDLGALFQ